MIWILRNISIHLWITTLMAIPLIFYILPGLARFFPSINPFITGVVTIAGIVVILGFIMDRLAKKIVASLIKEGQAWERSGILNKAENNYIKALRIYDSFLLLPFLTKKTTLIISGAIARFKLNTSIENQNFKLSTEVYLKMMPEDEDIAQLWLAQLKRSAIVTSFDQDVLSLLVETHYANTLLSPLMMDIFLGLERTDFIAKKLYQQVKNDPILEPKYANKIEALIGKPDDTIQSNLSFSPPPKKAQKKSVKKIKSDRKLNIGKAIESMSTTCVSMLKLAGSIIGSFLSFFILLVTRLTTYIKEHEKAQFYLKTGFLGLISIWLLFFMINTLTHMLKSRTIEKQKTTIEIQAPKPFTIQVAAYLKQSHAKRYVDVLKKKEIDARVKKVKGGGKTWFVVRVSKFHDKKSAAAYGQKLKQQKIIDDFFVNNR